MEPRFVAGIESLVTIPMVDSVAEAVDGLVGCATARGDQDRAARLTDLARGLRDGSRPVESVAAAIA